MLRAYEEEWLDRIRQVKTAKTLLVGPTGIGKTVVAVELVKKAVNRRQRVLFLAHRRELIVQASQRLVAGGVHPKQIGVVLGSISAEEREFLVKNDGAWIQIATLQSIAMRAKDDLPRADVIIVDEAHHVPAESYSEVLKQYPFAIVYGLTATPFRTDGRGLAEYFDTIVPSAPPSELIRQGWIQKPRIYTVAAHHRPRLLGLRRRAGDYDQAALERASDLPALVGSIVGHYKRLAEDRLTVAYGVGIKHCEHISAQFRAAGINSATLLGSLPINERIDRLGEFEAGKIRVLVNCQVLTEGWDCPKARCAIIARPTLSSSLFFQMVGRVTRPGSIPPIVLDHAGNVLLHGMPLEDVAYSLDSKQLGYKKDFKNEKICPSCENSCPNGKQRCNWCGYMWWDKADIPEVARGQLVAAQSHDHRCVYDQCPTPHIPVRATSKDAEPIHFVCKQVRARAERVRRKCEHPNCLYPGRPLDSRNASNMHKDCRQGSAPRTVSCSYCQKPVKARGSDPYPMHMECKQKISLTRRKCVYDRCAMPDRLLGAKAYHQGSAMHRQCAARARSERVAPTRARCESCGAVRKVKLISGRWCASCFGKRNQASAGQRTRNKKKEQCAKPVNRPFTSVTSPRP